MRSQNFQLIVNKIIVYNGISKLILFTRCIVFMILKDSVKMTIAKFASEIFFKYLCSTNLFNYLVFHLVLNVTLSFSY